MSKLISIGFDNRRYSTYLLIRIQSFDVSSSEYGLLRLLKLGIGLSFAELGRSTHFLFIPVLKLLLLATPDCCSLRVLSILFTLTLILLYQ